MHSGKRHCHVNQGLQQAWEAVTRGLCSYLGKRRWLERGCVAALKWNPGLGCQSAAGSEQTSSPAAGATRLLIHADEEGEPQVSKGTVAHTTGSCKTYILPHIMRMFLSKFLREK